MGKTIKKPVKYQGVSVPVPLIEKMRKHVKDSSYRSISSFVQEAIREKMENKNNDVSIDELETQITTISEDNKYIVERILQLDEYSTTILHNIDFLTRRLDEILKEFTLKQQKEIKKIDKILNKSKK